MSLEISNACGVVGLSSVSADDGANSKLKNLFSLDVRFRPQARFQLVDVIDKKGEKNMKIKDEICVCKFVCLTTQHGRMY